MAPLLEMAAQTCTVVGCFGHGFSLRGGCFSCLWVDLPEENCRMLIQLHTGLIRKDDVVELFVCMEAVDCVYESLFSINKSDQLAVLCPRSYPP